MKKAIEYLLCNSGVSNYKISKTTGIGQNVLSNYAIGKSDIGNMSLDNAILIYNYFKEMLKMAESRFGKVTFEGKEYILTDTADFTNRVLYDRQDNFNEVSEGEEFAFQMSASAVDAEGVAYTVYWIFTDIKGDQKELDELDYDNVREVIEK